MKSKITELDREYNKCVADGFIIPKYDLDKDLIASLLSRAETGLERLHMTGDAFEKQSKDYSFMLRDNYEILRMLIDAYLLFDKVNIGNHLCSNAYLCTKHPEFEFDWEILETMRILRNEVNYRGKKVTSEQWNSLSLPFKIYIQSLQEIIKEKLRE